MLVTKRSMLTDKENTREIAVRSEDLDKWINGMLIQDAMPYLSADDREFLMTGITPEEWEEYVD